MKKLWVFLLLILFSCQPDELMIIEPYPQYQMIFEVSESSVVDGQDISFEIITNTQHQLIITNEENSVVTKETFTPTIGINTRKIYTNSLPKGSFTLILKNQTSELNTTKINIE